MSDKYMLYILLEEEKFYLKKIRKVSRGKTEVLGRLVPVLTSTVACEQRLADSLGHVHTPVAGE